MIAWVGETMRDNKGVQLSEMKKRLENGQKWFDDNFDCEINYWEKCFLGFVNLNKKYKELIENNKPSQERLF